MVDITGAQLANCVIAEELMQLQMSIGIGAVDSNN